MAVSVSTVLMFDGQAEEAMRFYTSLVPGSAIEQLDRYAPGEPGPEGTVKHARFRLGATEFQCIDSSTPQPFTFTPALSLSLECGTEAALDALFTALSADGEVLMPLDAYAFSPRFGWVTDRFGVSWQLRISAGAEAQAD